MPEKGSEASKVLLVRRLFWAAIRSEWSDTPDDNHMKQLATRHSEQSKAAATAAKWGVTVPVP